MVEGADLCALGALRACCLPQACALACGGLLLRSLAVLCQHVLLLG